ncbi:MAG TPA: undecaprenyl-phosphate glucose phosphotransferase, partial [Acetobacteraceae bacterium]
RLALAWLNVFGVWMVLLLVFDAVLPGPDGLPALGPADRAAFALFFVAGLGMLLAGRLLLVQLCAALSVSSLALSRTVVFGPAADARRLAEMIRREPGSATRVVGIVDPDGGGLEAADGLPTMGSVEALGAMVRERRVDRVVLALPGALPERIQEVVRQLAFLPVAISLAPDLAATQFPYRRVVHVAGLPALQVCEQPLAGWARLLKKAEDLLVAALVLLPLGPLMLLIALAIRLDSPGPVLFRQKRLGIGNRVFEVLKFRTMHTQVADHEGGPQATRRDPRVTRIGAMLRRLSLDELPQLLNVLKGEMSVVGPRPHALSTRAGGQLFEDAVALYSARHRVKPGITGWAQVCGWRGETDTVDKIARRVEHGLYYVSNWSLAFDLLIILRTVKTVFSDENAY